jgi:hypothetical protein
MELIFLVYTFKYYNWNLLDNFSQFIYVFRAKNVTT